MSETFTRHAECIEQGTACSRLGFGDAKRNSVQLHSHGEEMLTLTAYCHVITWSVVAKTETTSTFISPQPGQDWEPLHQKEGPTTTTTTTT